MRLVTRSGAPALAALCAPPLVLPRQMDGSWGVVTVELAHSHPAATVYWHLDNSYLTQTQDFHKLPLRPAPGRHVLTAVDDAGNTVSIAFFVEE